MTDHSPTLHLVCGKIASGKSTLAQALAQTPGTVLISEDAWLSRLYPDEILTLEDYVKYSRRLSEAMAPHVESLLRAGLSVVLDFPANTVERRTWMRGILDRAGADHRLHLLKTPDEICRARLQRRNEDGRHAFAPSDADYDLISSYFVPPSPEEGFDIRLHDAP